jgi:hypothetical protein
VTHLFVWRFLFVGSFQLSVSGQISKLNRRENKRNQIGSILTMEETKNYV